jgi:hypothetical protein
MEMLCIHFEGQRYLCLKTSTYTTFKSKINSLREHVYSNYKEERTVGSNAGQNAARTDTAVSGIDPKTDGLWDVW